MALQTLESIFPRWATWKVGNEAVFQDSAYPLRPGLPKFAGTVVQRFNVRRGRAAAPYRDNITEIKTVTQNRLYPALRNAALTLPDNVYPESLRNDGFCLEEIPDFGGLLPRSHEAGVPVFALRNDELGATGVVLDGMIEKRDQIHDQLTNVANTLQHLMS